MANGNIFNNVRSQLGGGAPTTTQTAVQNIQAATAGKAPGTEAGPVRSTLAAQQAQDVTRANLQEVAQQDQATKLKQAAQAQAQVQQFDQQTLQLKDQRANIQSNFNRQAAGTIQAFQQQGEQLDLNKRKAQVEQLGFLLRLGNDKYIDRLQAEGQRERLDSSINFKEVLQRSIFSDELDLFQDDMDFRRMMAADQREFERLLATMDVSYAKKIAASEAKQANTQVAFEGLDRLVSGATKAARLYAESKKEE